MATCGATPQAHCCWVAGDVCIYLDPAGLEDGRNEGCTLRRELGSWAAVYRDVRYIEDVAAFIGDFNSKRGCGNYPARGRTCGECGAVG